VDDRSVRIVITVVVVMQAHSVSSLTASSQCS
jgi:hypothetical protein